MIPEMYQSQEQVARAKQQDQVAEEWGFAVLELTELVRRWGKVTIQRELNGIPDVQLMPVKPTCEQCSSWRLPRTLPLSDGTNYQTQGYCSLRAAADLDQMPQNYAEKCSFYEEEIPF